MPRINLSDLPYQDVAYIGVVVLVVVFIDDVDDHIEERQYVDHNIG